MTTIDRRYSVAEGVAVKAPCVVATTANITLSGEQTIDAVACVEHDRVLVKNQTDATENGIYEVSTGNWQRAKDFDGAYDAVDGTRVYVIGGATSAGREYTVTTDDPITIGTSELAFSGSSLSSAAPSRVFPTYTDLRNATPATGDTAIMLGFYAATGTGGGIFYWDSTSTATHNIGTVIQPAAGGVGRWLRRFEDIAKVEWFGAYGDGTHDDTDAIQACLDSCETVELSPFNTYLLTPVQDYLGLVRCCLLVTTSNHTIIGNRATLKLADGSFASGFDKIILYVTGTQVSPISNITIRDLVIDGNNTNQGDVDADVSNTYNNLALVWVDDFIVENCVSDNSCHNGMSFGGCGNGLVKNNQCENNGKNGIYVADYSDVINVEGNHCHNNNFDFGQTGGGYFGGAEYSGIVIAGDRCSVINNICAGNGNNISVSFTGSPSDEAIECAVIGNRCAEAVAYDYLFISTASASSPTAVSKRITIANNISREAGTTAFHLSGLAHCTCIGNVSVGAGLNGFTIQFGQAITLDGNTATGSARNGCELFGATEFVINGNNFSNNLRTGIEFSESGASGTQGTASNTYGSVDNNTLIGNAVASIDGITSYTDGTVRTTLRGSATWDPGSVADDAMTSTTVTVAGAAAGDRVVASHTALTAGWLISAYGTSANTVTVTIHNNTGGAVDLASGTLSVMVFKGS